MTTEPTGRVPDRTVPDDTVPDDLGAVEDDQILDPLAGAALIAAQRARVRAATDVDGRVLFVPWGVAWMFGFLVQWLAWPADPRIDLSYGTALVIFMALLVTAGVVTAVHLSRRSAGLRGASAAQGAMYGWAWFLSFLGIAALGTWMNTNDMPDDAVAVAMTGSSTLLVGALYMAGGAMLNERTQFALGAWICLTTAVGILTGPPTLLLVIALAGGGGMLLAALVEHVRRARRRDLRGRAGA